MMTRTRHLVTTKDGEQIAVWRVANSIKQHADATAGAPCAPDTSVKAQNIFLTHGTFSDKQTCLKIAEYLAGLGHQCYIMEWRGHGDSPAPKEAFDFETVATYDYEATFRYFFDELQLNNLHCVTHSGGGVGLTMFLIQYPDYIDKINSATMFACQAFGAAASPISYAKILAAKLVTKAVGYIPAKKLKLGPINESYHTMNQWFDWNLQQNFNSSRKQFTDNAPFDYRQHMPMVTMPIYAISAKGDNFISPTAGCRWFFDAFNRATNSSPSSAPTSTNNNATNVFREYARSHGDLDDYTHSRIMISRHAATEIWPTVAAWIEQHAR